MTKKKSFLMLWFWIGLGLAITLGILLGIIVYNNSREVKNDHGLPVVRIELNDTNLEEINGGTKDVKYRGNEIDIQNGSEILEYENVEIKGRGNATWSRDKKPYQIKFDEKVDVLGMGRARKWYLLANYMDETNLRTEIGFYLEEMLGMEYAMEGRFVELYIDNNYLGLYYLTQAVEIGKNSVDLKNPDGVLVEIDNVYGSFETFYISGDGDCITIKDTVSKDPDGWAMEGFLRDYNELELVVKEKNYKRVSELADVESFAKYYLLSEFTVNPDAYWTSFYMYKDGPEDKIHAGPGWDFDMALANRNWGNWLGDRFFSPKETMIRKLELTPDAWIEMGNLEEEFVTTDALSTIMFNMMEIPEFQLEVQRVYREHLAGRKDELMLRIKRMSAIIRNSAIEDEKRWEREKKFETETEYLLNWIGERYDYLDHLYNNGPTDDDFLDVPIAGKF